MRRWAPIAVACGLLAPGAAPGQAPETLEPDGVRVVVTGPKGSVEVPVKAKAGAVVRVIACPEGPVGEAWPPQLAATENRKPFKAFSGAFKSHVAVEWPAPADRTYGVVVTGSKPGARFRLKRTDVEPPLLEPPAMERVVFPVAIAPVAWYRMQAKKGRGYRLRLVAHRKFDVSRIDAAVLGSDGRTVRAEALGTETSWVAQRTETCLVRIAAPVEALVFPSLALDVPAEKEIFLGEIPVPENPASRLAADPPPEPGATVEREAEVRRGGREPVLGFKAEAGATYVIEAIPGTLRDPVLEVRGRESLEPLEWDDDGGPDGGCRATLKPLEDLDVFLFVRSARAGEEGGVKLRIRVE
ncbi:MAG: hypothetical protein L0216_10810 [Planctomycetales bacterium]|nr:hypothetical protein [Planctomycetales bacterium]